MALLLLQLPPLLVPSVHIAVMPVLLVSAVLTTLVASEHDHLGSALPIINS